MGIGTKNAFYDSEKKGPQTSEYYMHRFDQFIHLIVERVRRKLKVRIAVECFRQMNDYYVV